MIGQILLDTHPNTPSNATVNSMQVMVNKIESSKIIEQMCCKMLSRQRGYEGLQFADLICNHNHFINNVTMIHQSIV